MNNNLAVFKKPSDLWAYLQTGKKAVEMALPKHLNPDRMLRLALTCFSTSPKLRECSGQSILASIVVASQLGLEPGVAGQGYLIPYKNTCTFVPGWQGLAGLLNNSGRATAWTGAVFEGDIWEFHLGSAPRCVHVPGPNFGDPQKLKWAYACGKVNGSEQPVIEAWPIERVWKHRDQFNKVGKQHYSYTHPEMYARKVVFLQVLKYMPRSIELNNAIEVADAAEMGNTSRMEDGCVIVEMEAEPVTVGAPPAAVAAAPKTEPPKATPAEGLANLCKASRVEESDLMQYLFDQGEIDEKATTLADVPEATAERIMAVWVNVLGVLNAANSRQASASAEPQQAIPTDPGELAAFVKNKATDLDLDESQVVTWLKKGHKCGAAVKSISDIAQSGLRYAAENMDANKDEIAGL